MIWAAKYSVLKNKTSISQMSIIIQSLSCACKSICFRVYLSAHFAQLEKPSTLIKEIHMRSVLKKLVTIRVLPEINRFSSL